MGISVKGRIFIMNAVASALREYAAIEWPILNHKARMEALFKYLNKHFDRTGVSFSRRRVKSLYDNEPGARLGADEAAAVDMLCSERKATHDEYQALEERLTRLEAYLRLQDEDFHRPQVAGIRAGIDQGRG